MTNEELLGELLILWEEFKDAGQDVSAEELCKDWPELADELAERIVVLKRLAWLERKDQPRDSSQRVAFVKKLCGKMKRKPGRKLRPGTNPIADFFLIEKIGRGAFGEVWSAASGGRKFALKFIHGRLDTSDAKGRAEKELEGLIKIKRASHPYILETHSQIVKDESLILVTELADQSLENLFTKIRDQFPILRRCAYALLLLQNVAEALDHLQERYDLLHLDIKPANLLIVRGVCKIGDFGTVFHFPSNPTHAKEVLLTFPSPDDPDNIETVRYDSCLAVPWEEVFRKEATLFTAQGVFTPYYAPPEAFRAKNSRSFDQYSLALTFCELVAKQIPFRGDTSQFAQRNEGKMKLDFLPESLRVVIRKALAPKPEDRYSSCVAFINALQVALEPVIAEDKQTNNWEGWLLEMEAAAGAQSSAMLPGANSRAPFAGAILFPLLVITNGIRGFGFVADKVASIFSTCFVSVRNPNVTVYLQIAAIMLVWFAFFSMHQYWFSEALHNPGEKKTEVRDRK